MRIALPSWAVPSTMKGFIGIRLARDLLGSFDHGGRQSRQFGDMNTVTAVGATRHNFTEEDHVSIPFLNRDAVIFDPFP